MADYAAPRGGRTLLYYPTINLPRGAWLTRALLYWEQVGSIIPSHVTRDLVGADLRLLWDEGLYRPFYPEPFVNDAAFATDRDGLVSEFLSMFHSEDFHRLLKMSYSREFTAADYRHVFSPAAILEHRQALALKKQTWLQKQEVFSEKVFAQLLREIENVDARANDLAFVNQFVFKPAGDVILLEPLTAGLYMALLAKYLADADASWTTVGTDQADYDSLIFAPTAASNYHAMYVRLSRMLPVPRPGVSVKDVVKFRHRHWDDLLRFRSVVDDFHAMLSKAENPQAARDTVNRFGEKLRQGTEELSAKLHEAKISAFASSFRALIDLKSPTFVGAAAVASGVAQKLTEIPIEWSVGGLTSVGLIQVGVQLIDERNKQRAILRDSPFAYLYRGRASGILRPELW